MTLEADGVVDVLVFYCVLGKLTLCFNGAGHDLSNAFCRLTCQYSRESVHYQPTEAEGVNWGIKLPKQPSVQSAFLT